MATLQDLEKVLEKYSHPRENEINCAAKKALMYKEGLNSATKGVGGRAFTLNNPVKLNVKLFDISNSITMIKRFHIDENSLKLIETRSLDYFVSRLFNTTRYEFEEISGIDPNNLYLGEVFITSQDPALDRLVLVYESDVDNPVYEFRFYGCVDSNSQKDAVL